jgi:hypothetical protein
MKLLAYVKSKINSFFLKRDAKHSATNRTVGLTVFMLATAVNIVAQPVDFQSKGVGGGGALFFPTINPANDNEFYVSCDMSELFHSTDFGLHYSQVDFTKLQVFNTSTYEFTNNSNIAYSNFSDGNDGYPVKTTNGGASWANLSAYDVSDFGPVYALKANYNNPNQVLINSYADILFSNNGGTSFTVIKHASNTDVGLTFGGVFWDGANIYIGTNEGILFSTNSGTSFSMMTVSGITSGQVIWSFAGAKVGATTRFVCIASNAADTYNGIMPSDYYEFAKGVYTMDNAGGTWVNKSGTVNFSNDFVMYAAMARNDVNTIYLGGNDNNLGAPLVYKSSNAGTSWSKIFKTSGNENIITGWEGQSGDKSWGWSETCFGITVAPNNSGKVMFTSYSNVELSADGGANWRQAYVDAADEHPAGAATPKAATYHSIGLENTTCWQVHWIDANNVIGCFSDIGGIKSTDAGKTWGFKNAGLTVNSLYRITQRQDGTLFGACSNVHDMYQSTRLADAQLDATDSNGKIVYSADQGQNWNLLHYFGHPVFWVAVDPSNQNRMYASVIQYGGTPGSQTGGIYVTNNLNNLASSTWTKLANPPRTQGHPASIIVLKDGKVVCTFSGRRATSGFTASSGVFIYDPGTSSWSDVSDSGMQYWTKDIVLDPNDITEKTWFVSVFSGWGGPANGLGGLYKTTNRGQSWVKLTGSQFDRVTSINFDPQNTNEAYLTTETQGLWISKNAHEAAPTWALVESYSFRQPERVFFNPFKESEMWVSSFGNGMKVGTTTSNPLALALISFAAKKEPDGNHLNWKVSDNSEAKSFTVLKSSDGKIFRELALVQAENSGEYSAEYDFTDTTSSLIDVVYYRLRLRNLDNSEFNSRIIALKTLDSKNGIVVLGNPVVNELNFQVLNESEAESTVQVINSAGQIVKTRNLHLTRGYQTGHLDIGNLAKGKYIMKLVSKDKQKSASFVKP